MTLLLTIGTLVPIVFGTVAALNVDYGRRGGL